MSQDHTTTCLHQFYGLFKERKEKIEDLSEQTKSSNLSIWFGHYTTSLIVDDNGNDIRHLMK
jgi:hypothetical protein